MLLLFLYRKTEFFIDAFSDISSDNNYTSVKTPIQKICVVADSE